MPNSGDASAPSDASLGRGDVAHDALDERQERESPGDSCKRYFFGTDRLVAARQQQKLLDLYLFAVDTCLRSGTDQWWRRAFRFEAFPDAEQGLAALKDFCLHHLLYEGGDIAAFCRVYEGLEEEGYLEDDIQGRFLLELSRYLKRALQEAGDDLAPGRTQVVPKRPGSSENELHEGVADQLRRYFDRALEKIGLASAPESPPRPAIVSMVFPDEVAVDNFREFGAPSLCGERGLQALCGARAVSLLVFAQTKYLMDIKGHLEASNPGCQVVCRAIPPNLSILAEGATAPQRDWLVGALQGLHLREAKRLGADFLSVNPNAVYSDGFFEGVLGIADRQEPAVAVLLATIRADKNIIRPGLAQFRTARPFDSSLVVGTSLAVSAGDLLSQGIDTAGPLNGAKFVHDFGQLRGLTSHLQLTWREDDCVRIHSTRYEIAFLAGEMIGKMPPRFLPCLVPRSIVFSPPARSRILSGNPTPSRCLS